eukprot:scaffold69_cov248-Pinguiococcus_pyrenoidosus.AAC.16
MSAEEEQRKRLKPNVGVLEAALVAKELFGLGKSVSFRGDTSNAECKPPLCRSLGSSGRIGQLRRLQLPRGDVRPAHVHSQGAQDASGGQSAQAKTKAKAKAKASQERIPDENRYTTASKVTRDTCCWRKWPWQSI